MYVRNMLRHLPTLNIMMSSAFTPFASTSVLGLSTLDAPSVITTPMGVAILGSGPSDAMTSRIFLMPSAVLVTPAMYSRLKTTGSMAAIE